jgi:hypothetical protein
MWTYRTYQWADEAAWLAALTAAGWQEGPPPEVALAVVGQVEDGAGWQVCAGWRGVPEPDGWGARAVPDAVQTLEPVPTLPVLIAAVDDLVEATARGMDYKGAAHCAGYVSSTVPQWAAEALAFVAWRDAVWVTAYGIDPALMPRTVAGLLALLPQFVRPQA